MQPPQFDVERVRRDFPILAEQVRGKPLVYLDNAATSQKPQTVIDALARYYTHENANIHRGVHILSEKATAAYEAAREKVRRWIHARYRREVIFVRGTTEAINLVAWSFGSRYVGAGDEIVVSALEHHSNIVPWQMLCERSGAKLRVIPMNDAGELLLDEYQRLLGPRTRLVAVNHVSNALGTVNPVSEIVRLAHAVGAKVLLDGAQAAPHLPIDVQALDCDFYAFSGHKLFAPTGSGVLFGKAELLEAMPPYQGGGDMIRSVSFEKTTYADLPAKFEAGTPDIACGIGLGAAIDYLEAIDFAGAGAWEAELLRYATEQIGEVPGVRLIGTAADKAGVVSFLLGNVHPHDIGTILDSEGIAIRTGHHCAQPVMERLGIPATARASLAFYNTTEEVDALVRGLGKVRELRLMSELRDLYQEVILDHGRRPRNFQVLGSANRKAEGYNPLCGDRFTVFLDVQDGVVKNASFQGNGCAISTASASMMTEMIKGKSEAEAQALFHTFHDLIAPEASEGVDHPTVDLGKLKVFSGVTEYPTRVKCATLAWHTLNAAIQNQSDPISTE